VNRLDTATPVPEPGWAFRIHTLHTSETEPPYLTGTWHHGGQQPADPGCALWLVLAARAGGEVDLAVFADHEQITCEHTGAPEPRRHRAARAILAYLIAHH
jgi:hypothetical protein